MSLSVGEKLRVAHLLDDLGVHMIEAGFPASNPKEAELFGLLEREALRGQVAAFGTTRRRDVKADEDAALAALASSFAPVCTLVGKTWGLHLEKVVRVDRDENLRMIEDSVAFLVGEGKTVVYDAEHFFDGWADDSGLRAALPAGRGGGGRGLRAAVRHQRRHAAARDRGRHRDGGRRARHRRRDPLPRRRGRRRRQLARRRARRGDDGAGHDERLRRALRQRQPRLDRPQPPAQDGLRVPAVADRPDRGGALPRRAPELRARPRPALRGQERLRAQGRPARGRRQRRPGDLRAHRPGRGRQLARRPHLRALGPRHGALARGADRRRARRRRRRRASSSASRSSSTAASSSRRPTAPSTC